MTDRKITSIELSKQINRHPNSVGSMKNSDKMPRISGELLEDLCQALNCKVTDLIKEEE
jgi:DNA-binding Xre family transcriptional regulator